MTNKKTSKRIAVIAGRILNNIGASTWTDGRIYYERANGDLGILHGVTRVDLSAIAASALTQTPDKPRKRPKNGKKA